MFEPRPGVRQGRTCVALLGCGLGSNEEKTTKGGDIASLKPGLVAIALTDNSSEVVSKVPWSDFDRSHLPGPWMEHEGHQHPREGTSLGDAALLGVWVAKGADDHVDKFDVVVEDLVCMKDLSRQTGLPKQSIE